MAKASDIAKYIVNAIGVDNHKLQKLLYYSQAIRLVLSGGKETLFSEPIEAWDYGPVVPCVYHAYKKHGVDTIPNDRDYANNLSEADMKAVDMVLSYYGPMRLFSLVSRTHQEDPWKNAFEPHMNKVITPQSMYDFYKDFYEFDD